MQVFKIAGDERQAVSLCAGGQQTIDDGQRAGSIEACPKVGYFGGDGKNARIVAVDDMLQPVFQPLGGNGVALTQALDAQADFANDQHT